MSGIPTTKPLKICRYCGKEVANLGLHIVNTHPSIMEQLEEGTPTTNNSEIPPSRVPSSPQIARPLEPNKPFQSINEMIKEKIDTMMNIKLMQMLESNPNISIKEIKEIVDPPREQTFQEKLAEMKMLHDLVYKGNEVQAVESSGNEWLSVISNALPIVAQMLPNRQKNSEVEQNVRHSENESGDNGICGLIPQEIAGDSEQPSSIGEEPRNIGETKPTNSDSNK